MLSYFILVVQCNEISRAQQLFDQCKKKPVHMCAVMMKGDIYSQLRRSMGISLFRLGLIRNKMSKEAIDLYRQIQNPDQVILTLLFNACAQVKTVEALELGKQVVSRMPRAYHNDAYLTTAAFDMFIKCGDVTNAESLFHKMQRSIASYGNLMKLYNIMRKPNKTLELYEELRTEGIKPDLIASILIVNACSQIAILDICQPIVSEIPKDFLRHRFIATALVDMWVSSFRVDCISLDDSTRVKPVMWIRQDRRSTTSSIQTGYHSLR